MPANARPQARNWCFTLNNPLDEEVETLLTQGALCHYAVWQPERGANGTPHLQGYLAYKNRVRLATLHRLLPRAHFTIARGSPDQNRTYCTKPETSCGNPTELGDFEEIPRAGQRSDLDELQTALDAGLTNDDYATTYFSTFVRYPKIVDAYQQAKIRARSSKNAIKCVLVTGNARTGKTMFTEHLALSHGGGYYRHSLGGFWDGYRGESVVILEDFRGSSLSFGDFKRIVDRYAVRVHIKGTSCQMAATVFYITTNFEVKDWWDHQVTGGDLTPITGRITEVLYFSEKRKFARFASYDDYARVVLTPRPDNAPYLSLSLEETPELEGH